MFDMYELLDTLMAVRAPSGREYRLAEKITELLTPFVDKCWTDRVGNVIGFIEGEGENKKKVLFGAHMDEVGMIVTYIEGSGYVRFTNDGGPNMFSAEYREVVFENGARGMIVPQNGSEGSPWNNCVVDIGAHSKEEAEALVSVGETFAPISSLMHMAGNTVAGRPVDDRVGCAVQLMAAERISARGKRPYHDIYFAFTVQEELALPAMGAGVVAYAVQPDVGIAIDVCGTGDTIGAVPMAMKVGGGLSILVRDTTIIADKGLVDTLTQLAKDNNLPYQYEVSTTGGVDAVPMQKTGLGCKAGVISVPMRYLHTSAETMDLTDAEGCVTLTAALCDCPVIG